MPKSPQTVWDDNIILLLTKASVISTLQVGDISTLRNLKRLDLAQNSIQSTSFAATCTGLKWLSLAHNPVSDLSPLSCLQSLQARLTLHARGSAPSPHGRLSTCMHAMPLKDRQDTLAASEGRIVIQVLNVGHAKLVGKVKIGALTSLGALILNDNALTSISGKTCLFAEMFRITWWTCFPEVLCSKHAWLPNTM